MTSRTKLFEIFEEITEKAFQIMEGKNSDYASDEDSLANFRSSEVLNVDPRKALLIRMLDKIKRQVNYIERGELSVDSAEDDVVDLINYSVLLHALNREEEVEQSEILTELTQQAQEMGEYDDNWGASILKENLSWLDDHHYPATPKESTSTPIEHNDGYVVDQIREYEDGYEVCSGDKCARFKNEQIKGVYFNRMGTPKKLEVDDGRVYKIEGDANVESVCDEKYKLCYVENDLAFFTNDLENQWGDDWNDAPYEHNAGTPYNNDDNIVVIEFEGNFVTPNYSYRNSPYSVEQINDGDVWWLFNKDKKSQLYAGATIQEFKNFIKQNNGEIVNE